jgi:hypothetical protein
LLPPWSLFPEETMTESIRSSSASYGKPFHFLRKILFIIDLFFVFFSYA